MSTVKALFVVLDGLLPSPARLLGWQQLAGLLGDFRALGYKVIGIKLGHTTRPWETCRDTVEPALDALVEVDDEFVPTAWSLARRFSLNMNRSILVSAHDAHSRWAHDAGVLRFETPAGLFGI